MSLLEFTPPLPGPSLPKTVRHSSDVLSTSLPFCSAVRDRFKYHPRESMCKANKSDSRTSQQPEQPAATRVPGRGHARRGVHLLQRNVRLRGPGESASTPLTWGSKKTASDRRTGLRPWPQ